MGIGPCLEPGSGEDEAEGVIIDASWVGLGVSIGKNGFVGALSNFDFYLQSSGNHGGGILTSAVVLYILLASWTFEVQNSYSILLGICVKSIQDDGCITSLGTSFVVFVILVLLFLILSRNAHIYYPLRALWGELPFSKRRGIFTWVIEALKVSEKDLVA